LYQAKDTERALALAQAEDGYRLLISPRLRRREPGTPVSVLLDDEARPSFCVVRYGLAHVVIASRAALPAIFADLFAQRIAQEPPWPDPYVQAEWAKDPGRPRLALSASPQAAFEAALAAGFEHDPQERHHPHYFYYATGAPRFARHVKHPCRLGVGLELHALLLTGVEYDQSGEYTKQCLENGPSFVCEVDGVKVCWSCTHVGGAMGMIYTPPEHRGHGYGRSLAAFQIDYMLKTTGAAYCHVNELNGPSHGNLERIGMPRLSAALTHRTLFWPQ
jgi:GNAT superfamily N-acetyltransferase